MNKLIPHFILANIDRFLYDVKWFFIAMATVLPFYLFFRYMRKYIERKKQALWEAKHKNTVLRAQVETQEQTFRDLSMEIHDNIGQKLSLVKLNIAGGSSDEQEKEESLQSISGIITDLRDLSRSLSSEIVVSDGLVAAIETDLNRVAKNKAFTVSLRVSGEHVFLPNDREIMIYRIYQEAIQNILKHSGAQTISVELIYSKINLTLRIKDDGKGIPEENKNGSGVKNMEMRAKSLNGSFKIESSPAGTILETIIPINHEAYHDLPG